MTGETVVIDGVEVANVLVEPAEPQEAELSTKPAGPVIAYVLRLPCGYEGPVSDASVVVRGIACRSVGHADHYRAREVFGPSWTLPWDMTLRVERVEGDMREEVSIVETLTRYVNGYAQTTEDVIYEGAAQARMTSGSEGFAPDGSTDAVETWFFVVPWDERLSTARPGSTIVRMGGVDYDVASIADVDGKRDRLAFEAVRHG